MKVTTGRFQYLVNELTRLRACELLLVGGHPVHLQHSTAAPRTTPGRRLPHRRLAGAGRPGPRHLRGCPIHPATLEHIGQADAALDAAVAALRDLGWGVEDHVTRDWRSGTTYHYRRYRVTAPEDELVLRWADPDQLPVPASNR
jgi:hypothetical protein